MTFQEQVGRITAEDKFLYASESEIRKLLGDNPLSPAQMEGRLRANLYADVTLSSNRKRTSTLLSMGVKRGDPIELKLSKSGDVECFPIEAYWNDTKIGELRPSYLEDAIYNAKKEALPIFAAVSLIDKRTKFFIEIATYK